MECCTSGNVYVMCKVRIGTILRLPAQSSDLSFAQAIPGSSEFILVLLMLFTCTFQCFTCVHVCSLVWLREWTKEAFLSGKKVRSRVLTQSAIPFLRVGYLYFSPACTSNFRPQYLRSTFPCTSTFSKQFLAYSTFSISGSTCLQLR